MEDEGDDEEEDPNTGANLQREVAVAREAMIATQNDKKRDAMERAAEAAALASAACAANAVKTEDAEDEEDPLEKYMESIQKEVRAIRGNTATVVPVKANIKPVKNEVKLSGSDSIRSPLLLLRCLQPMETSNGHGEEATSRVTVKMGVAKRAKEKGAIMEQDIDGLEYSSEDEAAKPAEDLDDLFSLSTKKSKAVRVSGLHLDFSSNVVIRRT